MKQPRLENGILSLNSERFILRTLLPDDVSQRYVDWLNDPEINRYLEVKIPQTIEAVRSYVAGHDRRTGFLFGIFDNENRHIGNISLVIDERHDVGTIGVTIGERDYWGKNVVQEARQAVIEYAFGELELFKLSGGCKSSNVPAVYNYQRQGWKLDGIRKAHNVDRMGKRVDIVFFCKFRSDWQAERETAGAQHEI